MKKANCQMKRHLNIHCHPIQVSRLDNQKIVEKFIIKSDFQNILHNFKSNSLYALVCTQCCEFNNDYISNYNMNIDDCPNKKADPVSLFYSNLKPPCNDVSYFEFVEFDNKILIGTKFEIISYIKKQYDLMKVVNINLDKKIKKLDLFNKVNEKLIEKLNHNLEKEKSKNEKILSDLDKMTKEKNYLIIDLEKVNSKIEEILINLKKNKNEKNLLLNDLEKENLYELQSQLNTIIKKQKYIFGNCNEFNQILEKQTENNNTSVNFQSDCKHGKYDIKPIKDLVLTEKDWIIKYKEDKKIKKGVIGNRNINKSIILTRLSGCQLPTGLSIKTSGLTIRYPKSQAHNIPILNSKGLEIKDKENSDKNENFFFDEGFKFI